jgi:hypothetical protein
MSRAASLHGRNGNAFPVPLLKKRSITIPLSLFDIHPFLEWMREDAGIPFLSKLHHQNIWVRSRKAIAFFERFGEARANKEQVKASRRDQNGEERPIKMHFMILRRDWPLVEMHMRLRWPTAKIGTVRKKNVSQPVSWEKGIR